MGEVLSTPAVVQQHAEQDEHQQHQGAQDAEQEQGVVGADVPQARVPQETKPCNTRGQGDETLGPPGTSPQPRDTSSQQPPHSYTVQLNSLSFIDMFVFTCRFS